MDLEVIEKKTKILLEQAEISAKEQMECLKQLDKKLNKVIEEQGAINYKLIAELEIVQNRSKVLLEQAEISAKEQIEANDRKREEIDAQRKAQAEHKKQLDTIVKIHGFENSTPGLIYLLFVSIYHSMWFSKLRDFVVKKYVNLLAWVKNIPVFKSAVTLFKELISTDNKLVLHLNRVIKFVKKNEKWILIFSRILLFVWLVIFTKSMLEVIIVFLVLKFVYYIFSFSRNDYLIDDFIMVCCLKLYFVSLPIFKSFCYQILGVRNFLYDNPVNQKTFMGAEIIILLVCGLHIFVCRKLVKPYKYIFFLIYSLIILPSTLNVISIQIQRLADLIMLKPIFDGIDIVFFYKLEYLTYIYVGGFFSLIVIPFGFYFTQVTKELLKNIDNKWVYLGDNLVGSYVISFFIIANTTAEKILSKHVEWYAIPKWLIICNFTFSLVVELFLFKEYQIDKKIWGSVTSKHNEFKQTIYNKYYELKKILLWLFQTVFSLVLLSINFWFSVLYLCIIGYVFFISGYFSGRVR